MRRNLLILTLVFVLGMVTTYYARATVICTPLGALTANLSLCKPVTGELSWAAAIDNNFDVLDALFPSSILGTANGGTGTTTGVTQILANTMNNQQVGGGLQRFTNVGLGSTLISTIADAELPLPAAYTFSKLFLRTEDAQGGGGTLTFTIFKNGVATAIVATVPAGGGSATYSDTSHTAVFTTGDLFLISIQNNDVGASAHVSGWSVQ